MSKDGCATCRNLERVLLSVAVRLAPCNWADFPEQIEVLDFIKSVLRPKYRRILNAHLGDKENR